MKMAEEVYTIIKLQYDEEIKALCGNLSWAENWDLQHSPNPIISMHFIRFLEANLNLEKALGTIN